MVGKLNYKTNQKKFQCTFYQPEGWLFSLYIKTASYREELVGQFYINLWSKLIDEEGQENQFNKSDTVRVF